MANLSSAEVEIEVEKVGKEFLDYVKATNQDYSDYAIVYGTDFGEPDKDGNLSIKGSSSGRWAYSNNLEGYFDPSRVKSWLGVDFDWGTLKDDKQKEYAKRSNEQYEAYLKLVEALKQNGGRIEISYTDCDPAMGWMGSGGAVVEVEDDEVTFIQSFESENLTLSGYAELQGISETEALEWVHGDDVAEAYYDYVDKCKAENKEPVEPDNWYDSIYEEE